ncbi:MAG: aquaporin family protein [Acidobacteria bacterium]|nr:MAG: aquaporin family protein [Acidobacteriota bacterium]REJ98407.1 MAG: aquaporin family protein [Acidobacteriota bacterium]REK17153.1 MAG: aquaporin family protein [Acidobacteriota bacterium]REK43063.1 MAG: aquaporin family protein [Acidobacteriota bacterium]
MLKAVKEHWPEYLMEAWGLGIFMVSACTFGVAFYHPGSPLFFDSKIVSDAMMGLVMGLTAIGIILSPWGKRSGAHINPAVTITFLWLGKIKPADAVFYIFAQFAGASAGVLLSRVFLDGLLADASVNFVVTVPGAGGALSAFTAEFVISFLLMTMVLVTTNSTRLMSATPFLAGLLIANFIVFEGAFSGMSMNPARTFGSAASANVWTEAWLYFVAPPLAMLSAARVYVTLKGKGSVKCAKYHHHNRQRCIFCGKPDEGSGAKIS